MFSTKEREPGGQLPSQKFQPVGPMAPSHITYKVAVVHTSPTSLAPSLNDLDVMAAS